MSTAVKHYLEQLANFRRQHWTPPEGFKYASFEEFILKEGRAFTTTTLSDIDVGFIKITLKRLTQARRTFGQLGDCYSNAVDLALQDGFNYVEGYATTGLMPVGHAWATYKGAVINPTRYELQHRDIDPQQPRKRRKPNRSSAIIGVVPGVWEYYGVEFETYETARAMVLTGMKGGFLSGDTPCVDILREGKDCLGRKRTD